MPTIRPSRKNSNRRSIRLRDRRRRHVFESLEPRHLLSADAISGLSGVNRQSGPESDALTSGILRTFYEGVSQLEAVANQLQSTAESISDVPIVDEIALFDKPLDGLFAIGDTVRKFAQNASLRPEVILIDHVSGSPVAPTFAAGSGNLSFNLSIDGGSPMTLIAEEPSDLNGDILQRANAWKDSLNNAASEVGIDDQVVFEVVAQISEINNSPAIRMRAADNTNIDTISLTTPLLEATDPVPAFGQVDDVIRFDMTLTLKTLDGDGNEQTIDFDTRTLVQPDGSIAHVPVKIDRTLGIPRASAADSIDNAVAQDLVDDLNRALGNVDLRYPEEIFDSNENVSGDDTDERQIARSLRSLGTYLKAVLVGNECDRQPARLLRSIAESG
ncbi:LEPR-XLL domain-containing protein [Stieleria varia]|uniref:Uncharacterized protein n=1 Tax=Stieleria varia TaxID=2528005 RepID=A0A5C5ZKZ4_9BACT|nr:LEPR-XLL domain-containing protein [Stieleria varia]TWT87860.1 hypothetical protein Pla52n_69670 [Stieleria varia]